MNLDPSTFVAGGFALGIVAALWSRIKSLATRLLSYVVVTVDVESAAATAVVAHCRRTMRASRFGPRRYCSDFLYVRPSRRRMVVAYEAIGTDATLFWAGWRPLLVRRRLGDVTKYALGAGTPLELTFLRGTFTPDDLVTVAVDALNGANHGDVADVGPGLDVYRVQRYRLVHLTGHRQRRSQAHPHSSEPPTIANMDDPDNGPGRRILRWNPTEIGEPLPDCADPLAYMALTDEQRAFARDAGRWLESQKWFDDRGVPWRLGVLLWGRPGTGKTSYVRALCQALDLPLYTFDLATFDNESFVAQWTGAQTSAPCAVLLEDIDAVFDGRVNVTEGETPGLTFDCLLNCISGVAAASGVLLVVTTNHPEKLDPALGCPARGDRTTRPGRLDRAVEFGELTEAGRAHVAARILAGYPEAAARCVADGAGDTGAGFEERCARIALALYWADHHKETYGDNRDR